MISIEHGQIHIRTSFVLYIALEKKDTFVFYFPKKFNDSVLLTAAVFYSTDWQAHSKSSQPCGEAAIFQG